MGTNKNKPKQQMLPCPGNDNAGQQHSHGFTIECFRCGKPGHYARNCHVPIITGHMQVAMQPQNQLQQSPQQQLETYAGMMPGKENNQIQPQQKLN